MISSIGFEQASIMDITPSMAAKLLESSPGNRKLRGWYVSLLASAMKRGEWRVTSQGIGIDSKGRLRDAHHRLNACVESGVSFRSVVVTGLRDDAYEVIDTGMKRKTHDLLNVDRRVADVYRLAAVHAVGCSAPTIDQIRPVVNCGLGDAAEGLIQFCGATRRFYSSAPMKLAACITIMSGADADYVLSQYRSLVTLNFDAMSISAKALVRQVDSGKTQSLRSGEVLARGMRVFDKRRELASRIQVSEEDIASAITAAKSVLTKAIKAAA